MSRQAEMEWWRPDVVITPEDHAKRPPVVESPAPDSAVPFWGMMIFTFILLFAPQNYVPSLAPFRIALLTAVLALSVYLVDRIRRGQPIINSTPEMWTAAGLVGWAALTIPFSFWPGGSLAFLLGQYLRSLVIFWLLSHTVTTLERLRTVAWALSLMAIGLGAIFVANYLAGAVLVEGEKPPRIIGAESVLKNPNDMALMLNLILPLSLALLFCSRAVMARALLLVAISVQVTAIIITYSRAGFLTLAATVAVYLWKLRNRAEQAWVWAALIGALACVPMLPDGYFDRLSTITDIKADHTGSAQERLRYMLAAVDHVLESPLLGAGVGMNLLALNEERGARWRAVHNVYLQYAVDLGLPGLTLFLLLYMRCYGNTMMVQRQRGPTPASNELVSISEGLQVSLIAFAVAAPFHPVAYHFYFYYLAGLAVAVRFVQARQNRQDHTKPTISTPGG